MDFAEFFDAWEDEEKCLEHYGVKRRSGRYPWGSGENPYQSEEDFIGRIRSLRKEGMSDDDIAKTLKLTKASLTTQITQSAHDKYEKEGLSEVEIAKKLGLTTTQLRTQLSLAKSYRRAIIVSKAHALKEKGLSGRAIAKEMGYNSDSSIRAILDEDAKAHREASRQTADFLREQLKTKEMIDVGRGIEKELNISKEKLDQALYILEIEDGCKTFGGGVKQLTSGGKQQTNQKVLCNAEISKGNGSEIYDFARVKTINDYTLQANTDTYEPKWSFPKSISSSRVEGVWPKDGGTEKDGLVKLRPGVEDLSLGNSKYAQVRILVDYDEKKNEGYYVKGMAVYGDPSEFPPGKDILVYTSKNPEKKKLLGDVLKPCQTDAKGKIIKDNPFGAAIKEGIDDPLSDAPKNGGQSYYIDKNGKKQLSAINKKNDEGDWMEWSQKLPSQFLAKQNKDLIRKQLSLSEADAASEYEDIMSINNPTLKKQLLKEFSDSLDKQASRLYASSLPGQKYHVILPLDGLKEGECYAPNYPNGTKLALIRYPHGGLFEIPILTVNNNNPNGKKTIGAQAPDAMGIPFSAAEQLSGADYDGDTVMAIPMSDKIKISSKPKLKGLEGFDNKAEYPYKEGIEVMKKNMVPKEMGSVSNLIMDMTLQGATDEELTRAVKHSMVVIDAKKHKLDFRQSEIDNDIQGLKEKYQGRYNEETGRMRYGAATLITQAGAEARIEERKEGAWVSPTGEVREYEADKQPGDKRVYIDPKTGKKLYSKTGRTYTQYTFIDPDTKEKVKRPNFIIDPETGKKRYQTPSGKDYIIKEKEVEPDTKVTNMDIVEDAHQLSSGTEKEELYADFANYLKALANQARKEYANMKGVEYSPSAKKVYEKEVNELKEALNISEANVPREREAQRIANTNFKLITQDNPYMEKEEYKKWQQRCLSKAREQVGAHRISIEITPKQWEAIQAGAVSNALLERIFKYADSDKLREYASPKKSIEVTPAKGQRILALANNGYTTEQIAEKVGYSKTTVLKYLKERK